MKDIVGRTTEELVGMRKAIEGLSESKNRDSSSIWIYSIEARRKLDRIDRAITENLRQGRIARGEVVDDQGYSGRQTNKRR